MCSSKPKAPVVQPTPLPPPPPAPTPTAPVIDQNAKDRLLARPKRVGLSSLRIPLSSSGIGLNIPMG